MNARDRSAAIVVSPGNLAARITAVDWQYISDNLDARGNATIERLITPAECEALSMSYPMHDVFRSRVVMERHGFGRGEYKYFSYPLPAIIASLRRGHLSAAGPNC